MNKLKNIILAALIICGLGYPVRAQVATSCIPSTSSPWCFDGSGIKAADGVTSVTMPSTGQTLFPGGTAALPGITNVGDPDTGAWFPAADTFAISTGGVERIRWDSSGIITGTANAIPDSMLSTNIPLLDSADITFIGNMNIGTEGGGAKVLALRGSDATSGSEGGELALYLADDFDGSFQAWIIDVFEDDMRFIAGSSERMRIASNGFIGFGEGNPATLVQLTGASTPTLYIESTTASNGGRFILEDTDGAGCSQATALNGVVTWGTVTCP